MNPRVITQPLGGNPLAASVIAGTAPADWYEPIPKDSAGWSERLETLRSESPADWLEALAPAFGAGSRAKERLEASAGGRGVVVTTGQQPGLFGGPVYTISKALTALAMADVLQAASGIPVAPVFWAATDDTDFKEASSTVVAIPGGAQLLRIDHAEPLGRQMAAMSLGDVSDQLAALIRGSGSAIDRTPIDFLERFYVEGQTVGSAYVSFLRALLQPLGIAVIDASHDATRSAARPTLTQALVKAAEISEAIAERNREIDAAGYAPQVQDVPGLSLVFTSVSGARRRIPIKAAKKEAPADIGPNVLLRPIVERAILPTATYIGGPAEIAYFAQLSPIAEVLAVPRPMIVPRWSGLVIEPHVEKTLEKLYLLPEDFRDPHEVETRVARAHVPQRVLEELNSTRGLMEQKLDELSDTVVQEPASVSPAVTDGLRANLLRRLDRFERRLLAAAKKQHADIMLEIATARGSLYPLGKPQERALNFVPLLARYGPALRDDMLAEARSHAQSLVGAQASQSRLEPMASVRERS